MKRQQDVPPPSRALTLILLLLLLGGIVALLKVENLAGTYSGLAVFMLIPAALGGLFSQFMEPAGGKSAMGCFLWPTLAVLLVFLLAWLALGEGAVCIAIVLPFWLPMGIMGALVGLLNTWRTRRFRSGEKFYSVAWLALPAVVLPLEAAAPPPWQEHAVMREIVVDADANDLWPLLVTVPDISPEEGQPNFTQDILGVPRPSNARLINRDGQWVRLANWGWGHDIRFEEAITELRPGQSIAWEFRFPNDSVQRYTDEHVSPDGPMLKMLSGRYDMQPLANGKTRLRLTTTYRMRARLDGYLAWWGEVLLGDVQDNVLTIIRDRAEHAGEREGAMVREATIDGRL